MSENHKSPPAAKSLPSLLEAAVEIRFLLLLLCFVFYLDIWLLESGVNPLTLSLQETYKALLSTSVFSLLLFVGSYSLLMAGFFLGLRKVVGLLRLYFQSGIYLSNGSEEQRRLSDWSMAFVCLSAYSALLGYFFVGGSYTGIAVYVLNFLASDGVAEVVFRFSVFVFWLYCVSLAINVDDPSA